MARYHGFTCPKCGSHMFGTKGWALAVHGSLARDFDLVAIPWHHDPVAPERCIESVRHYYGLAQVGPAVTKLHGRKVFTLALKFGECFLDLSFIPTTPNAALTGATPNGGASG